MARRTSRPLRKQEHFRETLAPAQPYATPVAPVAVRRPRNGFYTLTNLLYLVVGIVEAGLILRFFFLLFGANPNNGFVNFIYTTSQPLVTPFYNIFGSVGGSGGTLVVFDPSTLVAAIVYGIVGWALLRLLAAAANRPASTL